MKAIGFVRVSNNQDWWFFGFELFFKKPKLVF
jgi:hypothetical protein